MSPRETILTALADLLRTVPHVPVLRGEVLPERIPPSGLMIVRDGNPGEPGVDIAAQRHRLGRRRTGGKHQDSKTHSGQKHGCRPCMKPVSCHGWRGPGRLEVRRRIP